ncbi:MAG TPA: SDR family oxidoreductase [Candidatus Binataceae bacterium]|nr:SDR family oxidoreductase [Candidatus Binataceae bacterium]
MRVFVTGATGFIGSAVVKELICAGHQVLGLARSDAGAKSLSAVGAEVHRGDLEDLGSLRSGAAKSDGVIHTAFDHDFTKFAENCEMDRRAIEALGTVLEGSDRPFLVTSGLALLTPPNHIGTEDDEPVPPSTSYPRVSEATAASLAARGVRASVVRLPPSVHGDSDPGFVLKSGIPVAAGLVTPLIAIAREKGVSAYLADGLNRWPAVHRLDAARLYRLVLEKSSTGARYHGVADEGVPLRDIAAVIGRRLNIPVVAKSPEEAADHFGDFTVFASFNVPASGKRTQEMLGWQPHQPGLITDIDRPEYFETGK